jgi:hypothetical protein
MALPEPAPGLVICYSYLWHDERRRGVDEGRKDRPCAIVVARIDEAGDTSSSVKSSELSAAQGFLTGLK